MSAQLFGPCAKVESRAKKMAMKVGRGVTFNEVLGSDTLDTFQTPALLMVTTGIPRELASTPLFYPGALLGQIHGALVEGDVDQKCAQRVFEEALETPAGTLAVISSRPWLRNRKIRPVDQPATSAPVRARLDEQRTPQFLDALVRYWDVLDADGARYSDGDARMEIDASDPLFMIGRPDPNGLLNKRLWEVGQTAIQWVLHNLGVPLVKSLPKGGIKALLVSHGAYPR